MSAEADPKGLKRDFLVFGIKIIEEENGGIIKAILPDETYLSRNKIKKKIIVNFKTKKELEPDKFGFEAEKSEKGKEIIFSPQKHRVLA